MTYKEIAKEIVDKYLEHYGISFYQLNRVYSKNYRAKVYNGIHLDSIRMALSYYLRREFPLSYPVIRDLVGYKNHSTMCQNRKRIRGYIETNDKYFMPYWDKLLEIAGPINPNKITVAYLKNGKIVA